MRTVRLKQLTRIAVSNVDKKSVNAERRVRLCNYTDVYYNEAITLDLPFMEATATTEQIARFSLRAGDILITKDSETADDIAVPAYVAQDLTDIICGYHLAIIRPSNVNGRYLFWVLTSLPSREQLAASATGVTRFGLRYESIGDVRVPVTPLATQRAIADFLDTETARIDGLIEKKQRLTELLEERLSARVSLLLQEAALEPTLLKHLVTKVGSGATPRGGSEVYEQTGVAFLRSQNIRYGQVDHQDLVFINHADDEALARTRVQNGDVLLNITGGSLGRSAVASVSDLPANVSQHVCIIRPRSDVDPLVLQASIESNFVQDQIRLMQVGGNRDGLNFEQVRSLRVQMPSGSITQLREEIEKAKTLASTFSRKVTQQIDALKEHRRALITAAVTGQLDIPGAAA